MNIESFNPKTWSQNVKNKETISVSFVGASLLINPLKKHALCHSLYHSSKQFSMIQWMFCPQQLPRVSHYRWSEFGSQCQH